MNALWLTLGVMIGAAVVAFALRPRLRALGHESSRAGELERELVRARADLGHERERAAERLATVNDAQERLSASFKALSADALQASMAQLTELARAQLQTAQTQAKGDLDQRQQAVEQLVAPLKEQLGRVDGQLVRLDQERRESRGRLESQLRTLSETGDRAAQPRPGRWSRRCASPTPAVNGGRCSCETWSKPRECSATAISSSSPRSPATS